MTSVAVLDACVLYPPSLRDLLMWLASSRVYTPRFTEEIHAEWTRNVLADSREAKPAQIDRTRRLMNQVVPKCLVSGYESHIPGLSLPDADDRHVLAAAIEANASLIVTYNLADFPTPALAVFGVQAVHPDAFLGSLLDAKPALFLSAVRNHRASLHNPPKDVAGYLQTLKANRLTEIARRLAEYEDQI